MIPLVPILNVIDSTLNVVEKALPTTEERQARMAMRKIVIMARAAKQAERARLNKLWEQINRTKKALKLAKKLQMQSSDISADLQKLLEEVGNLEVTN